MPDDISTFGLDPILPAMATLHSILSRHSNNQETGHAVHLLEYVHAQIPDPSSDLQMSYTDMLILLKAEVMMTDTYQFYVKKWHLACTQLGRGDGPSTVQVPLPAGHVQSGRAVWVGSMTSNLPSSSSLKIIFVCCWSIVTTWQRVYCPEICG